MFEYESDMIPVLKNGLAKLYNTKFFATEFNTGNGIADLVFSKKINKQPLIFNSYRLMSLYIKHFNEIKKVEKEELVSGSSKSLNELLDILERQGHLTVRNGYFIQKKKYKPHVEKMIAIEAKLKDWKSGISQALRYQFFTHKSFLAYPSEYVHRVDLELLKKCNVGLISVSNERIKIVFDPIERKPIDTTSFYFLSECFAQRINVKA